MTLTAPIHYLPIVPASRSNPNMLGDAQQFGSKIADLAVEQRATLERLFYDSRSNVAFPREQYILSGKSPKTIVRESPNQSTLENRVFDSGVKMKVAVSQYAMHLSQETREKLFQDLDEVVNVEDWYDEDALPREESFRDFLKWTIYSKRFNWISIGISEEGNVLVAWKSEHALLTASFEGNSRVIWAVKRVSEEGETHVAGNSPLQFFEREASFYLD